MRPNAGAHAAAEREARGRRAWSALLGVSLLFEPFDTHHVQPDRLKNMTARKGSHQAPVGFGETTNFKTHIGSVLSIFVGIF